MQGRPAGHQIDPLAIIVGLEEQVNESSQRIDNALKNLVDLAKAVRSLVDKVEQLQTRVEERSVMPEVVYGPDGEIHSETIAAIQVEHSALLQRLDDLEQRQTPTPRDYAPEFQRAEADIEALRIQISSAVKRQQEQENSLREFEQLAPKLNQKLTDVARKYPDGSLAKVEDIERIGAAIAKIHKEQSKVEDRFKEFTQLKESSALLTILKTEHSAVLRRIENLEAAGPGSGEISPVFDEVRQQLESLAAEQVKLKDQIASNAGQTAEAPDVAPLIEAAIAPIRTQVGQLSSGPQIQTEVTRQIEAALEPLRSRLDQLASTPPAMPDVAPVVESVVAPLRKQLAALETREPAQPAETGAALEKLGATLDGLVNDHDALLGQLVEQSKLLDFHKSELGTLHDAFDGVKKAAAGSGKPSPELIEAAAAAKHLQGVVEKLSQEHQQLSEQLKGVSALQAKVAELEQRSAPVDNSAELTALHETVRALQDQQSRSAQTLGKLESLEMPQPVDYSQDFTNLRNEIGALNALQQPLLERIAELEDRELPEVVDYSKDLAGLKEALSEIKEQKAALAEALSGDLAGVVESLSELKQQKAALAETLAKVESREIPEVVDYSAELNELRTTIEVLNEQQAPLLQRIAELESRPVPEPVDNTAELLTLRASLEGLSEQQAPLLQRIAELEGRPIPEQVDHSTDLQALRDSLAEMQVQHAQLSETLRSVESRELPAPADYSGDLDNLRAAVDALSEQQTPLVQRLAEVESRPVASTSDSSADVARIQSAVEQLRQQTDQVGEKLTNYAEQQQITKVMETLSELQTRLGRTSDQLLELEQSRNQVTEEQRKQLQNQLDIQERQRAQLEELQVRLEVQQEQIEAQQKQLAEFVEQARLAAEKKRRASDEEHKDPTMGPLIESALHIERGEYAEAVRCLEAARQLGENPKLDQALALARRMLEQSGKK